MWMTGHLFLPRIKMYLTAAATVALCASLAAGYGIKRFPTGSSQEKQVCESLEPGHGLGIQSPSPDYLLSASKNPDGTVKGENSTLG